MYILKKSKRALGLNEPIKDNHGKPVTRREMIARGFMTGPAVIAAPSILAMMLGSEKARAMSADLEAMRIPCGIIGGAGKIPFICFDLAGGANTFGSEVQIGRQRQLDFLSTQGYAKVGLPGNMNPNSPNVEEARKMIENPRRSREAYAPDFSFTSADGEYISMDELRGKVVLLDFWGTWCPPCRESLPSLRDLYKSYSKEKAFMMISVSVRDEEPIWREFTAKNQMVWPQAFDGDGKIQRTFQVRAFPTYILIDHEGIIRYRAQGYNFDREANLSDAIHKAIKVVAKSGPAE